MGRGKSRNYDFDAIEHVGNDADEGGFLADEAAEAEREAQRGTAAQVPSPAGEPASVAAVHDAPESPDKPESRAASADESESEDQDRDRASSAPAAQAATQDHAPAVQPAAKPAASAAKRRTNDGPTYSPLTAEPPIARKPKKGGKRKPAQQAVMDSFIAHRTSTEWQQWSGRLPLEVEQRLKDRAADDSESSGRSHLSAAHYFDAALRHLPEDPSEQVALADAWLIGRWEGERPRGKSVQFNVSPEMEALLKGLKQSLRRERHGIIMDVLSAASHAFLDRLDQEGLLTS
ncbi:hypothetical protein [Streptomyces qinglanensis]|uniref:hypothetical protein n=1 Tax=Streptomyces qinglanensis TaxID=943816 RepID=UPI003D720502